MERISELLDNYGWANTQNDKNLALIRWMTETTNRILELEHKVGALRTDEIENLIERMNDLEQKLGEFRNGLNTLSACLDQVEGRMQ